MVFKVINFDEVTKEGERSLKPGDPTLRETSRGGWEGSSREARREPRD